MTSNYSQPSIEDGSSMFQKTSIMGQCDKITSCPRDESCKSKTLADTSTKK